MHITVPGYSKHDLDRVQIKMPVMPPHEIINREISEHPEIHDRLRGEVAAKALPPIYMQHPTAQATGHTAIPLLLYVDGVPVTNDESLLGFWVYSPLSEARHLVCALRKSQLCRCGCRSWCTLFVVLEFLRWSFCAAMCGTYPSDRPDNKPWHSMQDDERMTLAGSFLSYVGCLIGIKGDWAEFAHTFAFANWAVKGNPCLHCWATAETLSNDDDLAVDNSPWDWVTAEDYDQSCRDCEIWIVLDGETHGRIQQALAYDCSKEGAHGLALTRDIPTLDLLQGDRLEPTSALQDVGEFGDLTAFPCEVCFWRGARETRVRHRNPLLHRMLGICPAHLIVDLLHCLYLGIVKELCMAVLWELMLCDAWSVGMGRRLTTDEIVHRTCDIMAVELGTFYTTYREQHPLAALTEVKHITPKMFGTQNSRCLKTKAAETKGMFYFLCATLARKQEKLNRGDVWLECCLSLQRLMDKLSACPLVPPPGCVQDRPGADI